MHGNNQPAMTNNAIPMVRKRNLRVVDEPPVGRQLLCKRIRHGSIVVIRVYKCDHNF